MSITPIQEKMIRMEIRMEIRVEVRKEIIKKMIKLLCDSDIDELEKIITGNPYTDELTKIVMDDPELKEIIMGNPDTDQLEKIVMDDLAIDNSLKYMLIDGNK